MRPREIAIFRSTSDYAYGKGNETVPAGSILDFEIELIKWDPWELVHSKKDLKKQILFKGKGDDYENPREGGRAVVNYIGRLGEDESSYVFDEGKEVEIAVDDDDYFPIGFHECVRDMSIGWKVLFRLPPNWGYGSQGNPKLKVDKHATIYYEIELLSFENPREVFQLSIEEHFSHAERNKQEGNSAFKSELYPRAIRKYEKCIKILEHDYEFNDQQKEQAKQMLIVINCNLSLVYMKMKEYRQCIDVANRILSNHHPNHIKALARRGEAYLRLGDLDEAQRDLKKAFHLNKNNAFIKKLLGQLKVKKKKYVNKQKKLYGDIFV